MIVTGIDMSLTSTGVARISSTSQGRIESVALGSVKSQPGGSSVEARLDRMTAIELDVEDYIASGSLVVIESPAYSRSVGSRHERSGLWWLLCRAAKRRGARVLEVSPTARAKYATGKGHASKAEVIAAVEARYGVSPSTDDEADAFVLAAIGFRLLGWPIEGRTEWWMEGVVDTVRGEL